MDKKRTMAAVTDQQEQDELLADTADLSKPFPHKPNGHLWADAEELKSWRLLKGKNDERSSSS